MMTRSRRNEPGRKAPTRGRGIRQGALIGFMALVVGLSVSVQAVQPFVKAIASSGFGSYVRVHAMKVDQDGSVFVSGVVSGTASFNSTLQVTVPQWREGIFLAKQDPSGGWAWAKLALFNNGESEYYSVNDLDVSGTSVCVGGEYRPKGGQRQGFVLLQPKGNVAIDPAVRMFAGGNTNKEYASVSRVALDANDNVYAGGNFLGHMTDGSHVVAGITPVGAAAYDQDIFVVKLNSGLNFQWAARAGSSLQDLPQLMAAKANGFREDVAGLRVDAAGNVLLVINVAGYKVIFPERPVFLYNSDNTLARQFYTGFNSPDSPDAFGALMAIAARISPSGVWNASGNLEFNNYRDRGFHSYTNLTDAPATDMVLSGGKMYVSGTYRNSTGTNSYLMRVGADTLLPDGPVCYLKSTTAAPTLAKRVVAQGNRVFLSGTMATTLREYSITSSDLSLGPIDKEITSIQANEFLAAFDADVLPQWTRTTTRPNDELRPSEFWGGALAYDGVSRVVFWGGYFGDASKKLFLGEEENPIALGAAWPSGWIAALQDTGTYREQVRLVVNSAYGPITINGIPFSSPTADNIYLRDTLVSVAVPAQFPETLSPTDSTRQRCLGFRLDGTVVSGDANNYSFSLSMDSALTFNWQTEHKLTIASDHAAAGLSDSAAAGSAEPPIGISWVKAGQLVTAFIDGYVLPIDATQSGTRYIVTGYDATGAVGANRTFSQVAPRQQVPQFEMNGPGTITYHWRQQHRVQVSTTSENTFGLPLARQLGTNDTELARGTGSGDFWFDHGAKVEIGARKEDRGINRALKGWRNADPVPDSFPSIEFIAPDDAVDDATQLAEHLETETLGGQEYWFQTITNFSKAVRVTWDYGDLIYKVYAAIGDALVLPQGVGIATNMPPAGVRIVDAPSGSTGNDMQVWDDVADRVYPLRPGIFFLDWNTASGGRVVTEVFAGFPGDPIPNAVGNFPGSSHYRHIANSQPEVTPPVDLDPEPGDSLFFHGLKFQTGNATVVSGQYTATAAGKAVLLFSESSRPDMPAVGDLSRERLKVRVVETRLWDDANDWSGQPGMVKGPVPATIGTKVTSPFDTAGNGTGYLIHSIANYNASLYDREQVKGPIIPVNRALVAPSAENELVVVWYEKRDGILWPYQPVKYGPFNWPEPPQGTNAPSDALKRIVIASRLGSEGLDSATNEQPVFDPARYSDVLIYNQPERTKAGYNPNEEHARIYPSFLGNSSGTPAPAAFAFRDDLNISEALVLAKSSTLQPSDYTSDPYVLVQYFDKVLQEPGMFVYAVQREDAQTHDPRLLALPGAVTDQYIFRFKMKAGELVTAPYPLNLVIGLEPCVNTIPDLYSTSNAVPNGCYYENGNPKQRTWFVDHKGGAWAISGGSYLGARYYYRLASDFWYPSSAVDGVRAAGECIPFLPEFELAADKAGVFDPDRHTRARPVSVQFDTDWPEDVPVLKVGETLTYPGGEYKADNPDAPGLPGILGWASGEVVFDSMNPQMATTGSPSHFNSFGARIVSPLEERVVSLATSSLPDVLKAGSPDVRVEGDTWYFTKLPPSLQKRVFFRPLSKVNANDAPGVLGLKGFVNERTLGASDLTAAPPPVYALEPNILTATERDLLRALGGGDAVWGAAAEQLFQLSRNPSGMDQDNDHTPDAGWLVGLQPESVFDASGTSAMADPTRATPLRGLGPGLALVTNPALLAPANSVASVYVTLAENNDPSLGAAPVALHVIKIDPSQLYRGAIKTILPPNVFDEKITLRHTADFAGNVDQVAFSWWYREEDGTVKPGDIPPGGNGTPAWNALGTADGTLGLNQVDLQNNPQLLLADNLVFVRYRFGGSPQPWSDWAGAANSTPRDLNHDGRPDFRAQLATGWVKRVLDGINPYEARVREFSRADSPATAASIIQQLGAPYVGPVALNADKNVVENVGLIELYETVLNRARALSIDASQPAFTSGIGAAILLASTRLADFYTVLGNEAWDDALDPTIGYGNNSVDPGNLNSTHFCFENQLPSLMQEELALLRGNDDSFGRPVFNRLFWNFTKAEGEVAYALNYQITDVNGDGFLDENDAMKLYPQGHGDAWGYYLSAIRKRYDLLRHPLFNWEARSEYYNLLDVVLPVDFSDEKKFAQTAAARAQCGAEIVALTYRDRYVEEPDGQWQGYVDNDSQRAWGVTEWARRAGQAALFDWVTANALLMPEDTDPSHTGIQKIDRKSVTKIGQISGNFAAIQTTLDSANNGLNPLGLDPDVVPFDIDPTHIDVGSTAQIGRQAVQGLTHFEQIFERAFAALKNAHEAFDFANEQKSRLRQIAQSADELRKEALAHDLEFRNRLIEIFGTPYTGTVGPGKPYPPGYNGPDLNLYMYVDVNNIDPTSVPAAAPTYFNAFVSFHGLANDIPEPFRSVATNYFMRHDGQEDINYEANTSVELLGDDILQLRLPATAGSYTFVAPSDWGQRDAPGRLQTVVSDMMQTESDLALAVGDYDYLYKQLRDRIEVLETKADFEANKLKLMRDDFKAFTSTKSILAALGIAKGITEFAADELVEIGDDFGEGLPKVVGVDNDPAAPMRLVLRTTANTAAKALKVETFIHEQLSAGLEIGLEATEKAHEITFEKEGFSADVVAMLSEIEELLVNEGVSRIKVFSIREQLRSQLDQYRATLQEGLRILEERQQFNAQLAAATQDNRYHDVTFRFARHESLQRYRASFDLAARYCYLAAKAYDYESNFDDSDRASAKPLLADIVRERSLGELGDNQPLNRGGLAGTMARLYDNFHAIEGRLGFNNLQLDTTTFSLRREAFRIARDVDWVNRLQSAKVSDLWTVPEYRRFCRPFAARSGPEPGLVFHFGTQIRAGKNFFGRPLGPQDSAYDPTLYATRIRGTGIRFKDYPVAQLARTPYVYLVPAGLDVMTIPNSPTLERRTWNVVDQAIPVPYNTSAVDLGSPSWSPILDSLSGSLGAIRKFSSFRAGVVDDDPELNATRFIGRSVWNTDWLLIVPGQTLHADANTGLNQFIANVEDIELTFETYGYSGN